MDWRRRGLRPLLAFATGAALSLAFPGPHQQYGLSWYALVPLLALLRFSTPREGFRHGFVFGLGFWFFSLLWLMELRNNGGPVALVALGLMGLSAWCALFSGLFGVATAVLWRGGDSAAEGWKRTWFEAWRPFAMALFWCGGEYLRSTLFTGFAWNALGVSMVAPPVIETAAAGLGESGARFVQRTMLPVVQLAALGGVYAASFPIVLLNGAFAGVAVRMVRTMRRSPFATRRHLDLTLALAVLLVAMGWGTARIRGLRAEDEASARLVIAGVNPGLPCVFESNDDEWDAAYEVLGDYTRTVSMFRPDLIVWPETVLYEAMPSRAMEASLLAFAAELGSPILAGGTEFATNAAGASVVYNSSFLFGTNGVVEGVYRKQHLVPFGEYIPFDKTLTFLQRLAPTGVSCSPGDGPAVMPIAGGRARVSPLICFEDTVAGLSRAAVRAGADILVAQSNDAWFRGSSEPAQHHAQAVFRAVENRVPMVRASNQGASAVVTSCGASAENAEGGFFAQPVPMPRHPGDTPYAKAGDWIFGIPCAALLCGVALGSRNRAGARLRG
ncbi:MAG: apolipoprotein N-acyltransferase [Kiritimatiellia bacterium]|jgi:apolipoprotein N-acyltransferase